MPTGLILFIWGKKLLDLGVPSNILFKVVKRKYKGAIFYKHFLKGLLKLRFFSNNFITGQNQRPIFKLKFKYGGGRKSRRVFKKFLRFLSYFRAPLINRYKRVSFSRSTKLSTINPFGKFVWSSRMRKLWFKLYKFFKKYKKFTQRIKQYKSLFLFRKFKVRRLKFKRITFKKSYNNVFLTSANSSGEVMKKISGGHTDLIGSKRASLYATELITKRFLDDLLLDIPDRSKFDFVVTTPYIDKFIKNTLRSLATYKKKLLITTPYRKVIKKQLKICNIIIKRKIAHNGMRKPKPRRV